jgi:hypothetical protein
MNSNLVKTTRMSFKIRRLVYAIFQCILGTLFILIGTAPLIMFLPQSSQSLFFSLVDRIILSDNLVPMALFFEVGITLCGVILLVNAYSNAKRHHVTISVNRTPVVIEEGLITQYLEIYCKDRFPGKPIFQGLKIKRQFIEVTVDFPFTSPNERETLLQSVTRDINEIFTEQLGYPGKVHLLAGFQKLDS